MKLKKTSVKVTHDKPDYVKVIWVSVEMPKFEGMNKFINCSVVDALQNVENITHPMDFGASDFARMVDVVVDPRFARAVRQIRQVRNRAELDKLCLFLKNLKTRRETLKHYSTTRNSHRLVFKPMLTALSHITLVPWTVV